MNTRSQIQFVRRGAETWEVNVVNQPWPGVWEHEIFARVTQDFDGLYYVELATWKDDGYIWARQPRGYAIPRGASRSIVNQIRARDRGEIRQ